MALGLRLFQFANLDLRGKERRRALFERGLDATQFVAGSNDRPLRLNALRLDLVAQRVERGFGRGGCAGPERRDQFAGSRPQIGGQVGVFDAHPAPFAQFGPEFTEYLGRRAHAAALDQLVKPVRGRRDPEAEEQERADFAV
ncbi:hypothetical protein OKW27_001126 [Paraburkholderia sp. 35.1]